MGSSSTVLKKLESMKLLKCHNILFCMVAVISGCASVQPYQSTESASTEHVVEQTPQIGEVETSTVGSTMVRVKDYYVSTTEMNTLKIVSLPVGDKFWQGVSVGQEYPITGIMKRNGIEYLLAGCSALQGALTCVHVNPVTLVSEGWGNSLFFGGKGAGAKYKREVIEEVSSSSGFTNFELVYSGVSNNVLRLKYREFSPDDLAKPAFFQDLSYSMDDSSVFFKNIEIDVLEANNRLIKYVVKKL